MKDLKASAEKLRLDAEDAELISRLATDKQKRELYIRLAAHFRQLAEEVEAAIANRDRSA